MAVKPATRPMAITMECAHSLVLQARDRLTAKPPRILADSWLHVDYADASTRADELLDEMLRLGRELERLETHLDTL